MAKRGRPRKNNLTKMLKKPELWVGVFTVGLLLGVVGGLITNNRFNLGLADRKETLVSPVPEVTPYTQSAINNEPSPVVQKLAQTSSYLEVEVLENDSYWKIAKRVCDDAKRNFLTIQGINDDVRLYRGMTVKVVCE